MKKRGNNDEFRNMSEVPSQKIDDNEGEVEELILWYIIIKFIYNYIITMYIIIYYKMERIIYKFTLKILIQ